MCPEFDNEGTNDTSTVMSVESGEGAISSDDESAPAVDTELPDVVVEGTESAEESIELGDPIPEESEAVVPNVAMNSENYLLYGGTDIPEGMDYDGTLAFLAERLKYDGGELRQARQNKDGSGVITPAENTTEFCSYCNLPISGVDYYRLPDGRKRCTNCNRSLVKSLEELNSTFNDVLLNMELFFEARIDVPMSVEMLEERKLKKKVRKGLGNPPPGVLILGVAVERKGKYTVYVENGIPRASLIATLVHELTHIWQYTHWNVKNIKKKYGSKMRLVVYEGMAMWAEIQYLYHIGEQTIANRDELLTLARDDEYGRGFALYLEQYPLNKKAKSFIETPFLAGETPLDLGF